MAIIRSLEVGKSAVTENRTKVDATYQTVVTSEGGVLLHIATYGSDARQSEPKVSQVVQLDRTMALKLADIISRTFPTSD